MIGFFPEPYPDELLYSICARYSDRMQYPVKHSVVKELFGDKRIVVNLELPRYLDDLVAALPPGNCYTVENIIDYHTLLPFYSSFSPPEITLSVRQEMRSSRFQAYYKHLGIGIGSLALPPYLRFCPLCVQVDREQLGECYWHRLHQLPGVELCPLHKIPLENSQVSRQNRRSRYQFISAEQATHTNQQRLLNLSVRDYEHLLDIAHDADWLLKQRNLTSSTTSIHNRYVKLLYENGMGTFNGKLYINKIIEAFTSYYSPQLLHLLQCEFDKRNQHNWLLNIFRLSNTTKHPIRHLIVIKFLGYTLKDFFQLPDEFKPFGNGPWLCLNTVCEQFHKLVIDKCDIKVNSLKTKPVGTFHCLYCNFIYSRTGPDNKAEDKFNRTTHMTIYGALWESTLIRLWKDESVTLNEIAKQLGVSQRTVKRQAVLCQIPFPRLSVGRTIQNSPTYQPRATNLETRKIQKLQFHQNSILEVIEKNHLAGRKELQTKCPTSYAYLKKYNHDWLEAHLPPPNHSGKFPPKYIVDWEERDIQLAEDVKASVVHIRSIPERPIRITKAEISRYIEQYLYHSLCLHLDKLPLTKKVLAEELETYEEFAIRRIEWAVRYFRQANICPTRRQLERFAGIQPKSPPILQIKQAIDTALQSLTPTRNF
ncbi:Tn7-like transposition protein D [Calothrix sp. NIES-2100]|uniref:TnsD family Tn7-like transposition protein n=1 Tax=Calothrix sp. NIES-2100 TaxID=1954172 RepID=UPI000B5FD70C|nr:Tn7-like transposition protein D [Calothrix sp. NIES-2100]